MNSSCSYENKGAVVKSQDARKVREILLPRYKRNKDEPKNKA